MQTIYKKKMFPIFVVAIIIIYVFVLLLVYYRIKLESPPINGNVCLSSPSEGTAAFIGVLALGLNPHDKIWEFDMRLAFPALSDNVKVDAHNANHNPFLNNPRVAHIPIIKNHDKVVSTICQPLPIVCQEIVSKSIVMSYHEDIRNRLNANSENLPKRSVKEFTLYIHIEAMAVYGRIVISALDTGNLTTLHFLLFHDTKHHDLGVTSVADCKSPYMEH